MGIERGPFVKQQLNFSWPVIISVCRVFTTAAITDVLP